MQPRNNTTFVQDSRDRPVHPFLLTMMAYFVMMLSFQYPCGVYHRLGLAALAIAAKQRCGESPDSAVPGAVHGSRHANDHRNIAKRR